MKHIIIDDWSEGDDNTVVHKSDEFVFVTYGGKTIPVSIALATDYLVEVIDLVTDLVDSPDGPTSVLARD